MRHIRKANLDDCPLIRTMACICFPATYEKILEEDQIDYMMDWMYSLPSLREQMQDGHHYYIAYEDDEPVGYASYNRENDSLFHLQKIYVMPEAQGSGLGTYLWKHIVREIKEEHPQPCRMELNVNRHNKAIHFYEKMGMHKDRQGDFPIGEDYYMNDYIMAIDI